MAGRPCLITYTKNHYAAFFEGETPRKLRSKGSFIDILSEDDGAPGPVNAPFCRLIISDALLAELLIYLSPWRQIIDWTVQASDPITDSYSLVIYATNPGSSLEGAVTTSLISTLIQNWNGVIDDIQTTTNHVVCNITIFAAITSFAFFGYEAIAAVDFQETNYDQATGVHTITADYSLIGASPSAVEKGLLARGAIVLSNINKVITFTVARSLVIAKFKEDIQALGIELNARRYGIDPAIVDTAIANGGDVVLTKAELVAALVDLSD